MIWRSSGATGFRRFAKLSVIAGLAVATAGCSGESMVSRPDFGWWSRSSPTSSISPRPASADQLVGRDGACAESVQPRAIALGMTECELVRSAGPTQNIQIAANERGERAVTIVYAQGDRAGSYSFRSGVLTSIEAVAAPPAAPRAKAAKKPRKQPPPQR